MKIILVIMGVITAIVIAVLGYLYAKQTSLLYFPPKTPVISTLPERVEKIDLGVSYGYLLSPMNNENKKTPLLIFSHGNGVLADLWLNKFDKFLAKGFSVFIVEYPGYGDAQGSPSLSSIEHTMLLAYDTVTAFKSIDKSKVIAYGRSMGGGATGLLAKKRPLIALGLESTFSSLAELVSEYGYPSLILRDRYETAKILRTLKIPVFVYHGIEDEMIPFHHGETLHQAAKNSQFYSDKCGHNDCPSRWGRFIDFIMEKTDVLL